MSRAARVRAVYRCSESLTPSQQYPGMLRVTDSAVVIFVLHFSLYAIAKYIIVREREGNNRGQEWLSRIGVRNLWWFLELVATEKLRVSS